MTRHWLVLLGAQEPNFRLFVFRQKLTWLRLTKDRPNGAKDDTAPLLNEFPGLTLERVPGGQLQLPRVGRRVRTGDLAESPLIYIFARIGEIRVVEGVKRVKTDL